MQIDSGCYKYLLKTSVYKSQPCRYQFGLDNRMCAHRTDKTESRVTAKKQKY